MNIVLFGASGRVGTQLLEVLVKRGHTLTVFVHRTGKFDKNIRVIQGDIHDPQAVFEAVKGQDVVVSTLGSWGTKTKDILGAATKNIIPAMEKYNVKRFVSVTGAAAKTPGENLPPIQIINRAALLLVAKPIVIDAETHLDLLTHSDVFWTSVRAPVMTNSNGAKYRLSTKPSAPWATVSRHAVVLAMLRLIEDGPVDTAAPYITSH